MHGEGNGRRREPAPCGMCRMGYSYDQALRDSIWPASSCTMNGEPKPFVVTRNKHIAPKERLIERLPSAYSTREFYNHPRAAIGMWSLLLR